MQVDAIQTPYDQHKDQDQIYKQVQDAQLKSNTYYKLGEKQKPSKLAICFLILTACVFFMIFFFFCCVLPVIGVAAFKKQYHEAFDYYNDKFFNAQ